jgi:hypothetical protein
LKSKEEGVRRNSQHPRVLNPSTIKIPLLEKQDVAGDSFYIGSANFNFPVMVDLSTIDFLVFHPMEDQEGQEEERKCATLVIRAGRRRRHEDGPR